MIIVADEVGGNTSQKGDEDGGGEKYIVSKGTVPQKKSSIKEKHFTLLVGLTSLSGAPVMCVVIFAGEICNLEMEMGIDNFAEQVGNVSNIDFFKKNMVEKNISWRTYLFI